jgi:hypothetical protein
MEDFSEFVPGSGSGGLSKQNKILKSPYRELSEFVPGSGSGILSKNKIK